MGRHISDDRTKTDSQGPTLFALKGTRDSQLRSTVVAVTIAHAVRQDQGGGGNRACAHAQSEPDLGCCVAKSLALAALPPSPFFCVFDLGNERAASGGGNRGGCRRLAACAELGVLVQPAQNPFAFLFLCSKWGHGRRFRYPIRIVLCPRRGGVAEAVAVASSGRPHLIVRRVAVGLFR